MWYAKTLGQMQVEFSHTQELVVDPHVGFVHGNLLLDVEEPREFPAQETPNGASPVLEKLADSHDTS